ncbi:hypothetical protein GCM10022381_11860 [Leifsonia kafniensis]|uniref:DUF5134 domain-containing protein n=1 Tax=Leifsonia kafniensis TaxID=475957 RepID=A0ABP7KBT9_9MICO
MTAASTLTTIAAVTLVIAGMTAAVGRHGGSPLRNSGRLGPIGTLGTVGMLGTGAIMLGALVLPDFSHFVAASLTIAVLLLVLAGVVAVRIKTQRPLGYAQRTAVAVTVVDIAFMSAAVVLMPVHFAAAQLTTAQLTTAHLTTAAQLGGTHSGGSPLTLSGGMMIWLVLVAWAFCAAVLSVPAIQRHSPDGAFQLACSGCMITAMAAMAL